MIIPTTVVKHLLRESFWLCYVYSGNLTCLVHFRYKDRINKPTVRRRRELFVTFQYLGMQVLVYLNSITFNEGFNSLVVTFRLDTLCFTQ